MEVSVSVLMFVNFPFTCKVQRGVRCVRVGQGPVKVRGSLATPDSAMHDRIVND